MVSHYMFFIVQVTDTIYGQEGHTLFLPYLHTYDPPSLVQWKSLKCRQKSLGDLKLIFSLQMTHLFQFDVCGFAKETLILFHLDNNIYLKL